MKKFLIPLLLAFIIMPMAMRAQTHYTLTIGTGTSTNQYVPSYCFYNYSYTQSLYTASEVGLDGTIDTLCFYVDQNSMTRNLTIYMAEVNQSDLSSQVAASALQQVFSGNVSLAPGWVVIPLSTPFSYQDTGSLVIATLDNTGSYSSPYPYYTGTQLSGTRSRYIYQDGSAYNTSSSMSNTTSFLPNIRLGISSYSTYCALPGDIAISDINGDHATVTWHENGTATSWEVIVSDSAITDFTYASGTVVYDTTHTEYSLGGNTLYYVYVRAICDAASYSGWTQATTFRSACVGSTNVPYTTGFEGLATGEMPNCWLQVAQGSSSASTFPSAYSYATNARNGNVYFEFESSTGETEIAALPEMDDINTLQLSFYVSIMNHNFTFEVGVMDGSTFDVVDTLTFTVGSGNNWHGSYYPYTVYFDQYTGNGTRMAMRVTSSGSYTIMMDDLSVDYIPNCPPISNLTVSNVTTTTADLSCTASTNTSSFIIEYDTVNFTPGTSTAPSVTAYSLPYQLTGLDSGYTYYVYMRGDCSSDTTPYISATFTTLAASPATLPFSCNFEENGSNGWDLLNGTQTNKWYVGSAVNNGGSRSLYISNNNGTSNNYDISSTSYVYAIRTLALSEAGEYVYSYDWRNEGESHYYDFIRVFLAPASTNFSAGSVLGNGTYAFSTYSLPSGWIDISGRTSSPWTLAESSAWQNVTGTFTITAPNTYKLVFAWANDGGGGDNPAAAIDNVQLIRNTCPSPYGLTVTNITTTDVSLEWHTFGTETLWEVSDGFNSYIASDTTYTVTSLTPDHIYTFSVRAICDADDTSMAISLTARTLQSCIRPTSIVVDSILGDTVWVSWTDTSSASSFDLVYGPAGFNPDTAFTNLLTSLTSTNYMFTGLTMGQRYDFYVRTDCGGEQSAWTGPASAVPSYHYIMAATGVDTLRACGYTIYDNGGPDGNYSTNCNSTLVLLPSSPTYTIQLSGSGYVESGYDYLYIYDGIGTAGNLLYTGQGTFTMPTITSEEGAVTIVFTSDGSVTYTGYEITASCLPLNDCVRPSAVTASYISTTTAEISWTERGTATSWILQYDTVNFIPGAGATATTMNVTTNPTTLTGLDSGMTYYLYIASDCSPDTSEFTGFSFTTLASSPSSLPYICDFEAAGNNGWEILNGSQTNKWYVGSATNNGGSQSLYISNDNGTTNAYSNNSASNVFAYRNIILDSTGDYYIQYDWKAYGESCCDYIRVALVPATVSLNAGNTSGFGTSGTLPSGAIALDGGDRLNLASTWTTYTNVFNISTPGSYRLVFFWHNDGSVGTNPPAAIDNISFGRLSCSQPTNLAITRLTFDSVYLSWNANGSAGPWVIRYDTVEYIVTSTSEAIGDLTSGTLYTFGVATLCGSDTSLFTTVQATPGSWNMRANQTDTVHMCGGIIYDDGGATDNYSNSQDSYIILQPDTPNSLISLSGSFNTESCCDHLYIYDGAGTSGTLLWSDGTASGSTFGPIESVSGPLTIYFTSDGSVVYSGFEINVSCISAYCRILNLGLNNAVAQSASQLALTWDDNSALLYEVEYGNAGFTQGTGTTLTTYTNSIVIAGLNALTNYDVYVRSICSSVDTGSWAHGTFQTAMCENISIAENWDNTASSTTTSYSPIGFSCYNYSYTQIIIDSANLASLDGDITAFGFKPYNSASSYGSYYTGMNVYMANISESTFTSDFIHPDTNHQFVQVMTNGNCNFTNDDWQTINLDTAFAWDGHSNILISFNRNHGSYSCSADFEGHTSTGYKVAYAYDDYTQFDINTAYDAELDNEVGDIRLYSCSGETCRQPVISSTTGDYQTITANWVGTGNTYQVAIKPQAAAAWPAETTVTGNSYTFTGLTPATNYLFRVRQDCSVDSLGYSSWVIGGFVTDSLPCLTPDSLHTTATTNSTATFDWIVNGNETQWDIHVWFAGGLDSIYRVTTHPATIGGFTAGITYNATIRPICGAVGIEGDWSNAIQFSTAICPDVTGLTAGYITANSVTLSWNANSMAQSYMIEYGLHGFTHGTGISASTTTTSYVVNGLSDETQYDFQVRAVCGTDWNSEHWTTVSATTESGGIVCDAPTNVTTAAAGNSVTVNWTAGEGNLSFEIEYGPHGFSHNAGTIVTAAAAPATISNLEFDTQYDLYVRAICDDNTPSAWSVVSVFTTEEEPSQDCDPVSNLNTTEVTETSVSVSWTPGQTGDTWQVVLTDPSGNTLDEAVVTTTSHQFTGLSPRHQYIVKVRTVCGDEEYSSFVSVSFGTEGVGIDNVATPGCTIYPNPTSNNTTISVSGVNGKVRIDVVDINGRAVASETLECSSECVKTMDVTNLAQGAYFVRITGESVSMVKKLIVR